jgi:hypothetical protein
MLALLVHVGNLPSLANIAKFGYAAVMRDLDGYRCSSCNSADVARIQTEAIYDELIECRSCGGIFPIEYVGGAAESSAGLIEGPPQPGTFTSR